MKKKGLLLSLLLLAALLLTACGATGAAATSDEVAEETAVPVGDTAAPVEEMAAAAETAVPTEEPAPAAEESAAAWDGIVFETTDLEGNAVTAQGVFSSHTMTMVNVWASWCPPCVRELPELQRLSAEFAEKDCAIVGLLLDGDEEKGLADGKVRLQEAGATYTILLPWDGVYDLFPVSAIPTSFFIDSHGHVIGEPIVGAYVEAYSAALDAAIAETQD